MSKTLKRIPIDFSWPQGKTWGGYINPFNSQCTSCPECNGTGASPEAQRLKDQWYGDAPFVPEDRGSKPFTVDSPAVRAIVERNVSRNPMYYGYGDAAIGREALRLINLFNSQWSHHLNKDDVQALLDAGRLMDFTHVPRTEEQREIVRQKIANGGNSWLPESNGYVPSPEEVNVWSLSGLGHDSCNQWIVVKAECERLGVSSLCKKCEGEGLLWPSEEIRKQCEEWKATEPPSGEGYQLWQSEAPESPIFETLDELCDWCATNATTFGYHRASAEEWRGMLEDDYVHYRMGNNIFLS